MNEHAQLTIDGDETASAPVTRQDTGMEGNPGLTFGAPERLFSAPQSIRGQLAFDNRDLTEPG